MPARKSKSDAERCREALPLIIRSENFHAIAEHAARIGMPETTLAQIDNAMANLELARKVLKE